MSITIMNDLLVSDALERMGLGRSPFEDVQLEEDWWYFEVWGYKIYCYNFAWRRKALPIHDLHHVVTTYPCTMRGEMQVATWEFAAGRFKNIFANLFCLPLVAVGVCIIPHKTFSAFRLGKKSHSLFDQMLVKDMAKLTVGELRSLTKTDRPTGSVWSDFIKFAVLASLSAALILMPILVAARLAFGFFA